MKCTSARSSHTAARPQWLYGAMGWLLRPPPRAYLLRGTQRLEDFSNILLREMGKVRT